MLINQTLNNNNNVNIFNWLNHIIVFIYVELIKLKIILIILHCDNINIL